MRKFKFRYHHKEDGWCYIDFREDNIAKAFEGYEYRPHCSQLFQFTGLTDKNGKEIYEGDIIQCEQVQGLGWKVIGVVHFGVSGTPDWPDARVFIDTRPFSKGEPCSEFCFIHRNPEVIGNIYENPELLGHEAA